MRAVPEISLRADRQTYSSQYFHTPYKDKVTKVLNEKCDAYI